MSWASIPFRRAPRSTRASRAGSSEKPTRLRRSLREPAPSRGPRAALSSEEHHRPRTGRGQCHRPLEFRQEFRKPQLRAIALARHGYAVLAWIRLRLGTGIPGNSEGFEPFVAGGAIAGHEVWDIMRAADYLETRPEIDSTRLGVTGASGGGLQTFYAGAVDERFQAVMPAVALWPMSELAMNSIIRATTGCRTSRASAAWAASLR